MEYRLVRRALRALVLAVPLALWAAIAASPADAGPPIVRDTPSGSSTLGAACADKRPDTAKARCYTKVLLADIEVSHDPADELPRLDARTRAAGGFIAGGCHGLMHAVGREYARRQHVTLATLQHYLPKSDSPACSAGFGHGLIMFLGPQIVRVGPHGAVRTCLSLPTRMRQYTCVHGLGHAYMRIYDDYLRYGVPACRKLGPREAPDCAQGAFHDYWITTSGRDETKLRAGMSTSPRAVCGAQIERFVLPCWYRVYIERPPAQPVQQASDVGRLCRGLHDLQRAGCVAAASLSAATSDPFQLVHLCSRLSGDDIVNCLRATPVEELERSPGRQLDLLRSCAGLPTNVRPGCYRWFGKALAVVTNGRFGTACRKLRSTAARSACAAGARRLNDALVTFA